MVSRYLVDGIVIAGLIAGALGVFYLSLGFFGKHGASYLRPLLPASVLAAFAMAAEYIHFRIPVCLIKQWCGLRLLGLSPQVSITVSGILLFGITYGVAFLAQRWYAESSPARFYKSLRWTVLVSSLAGVASLPWVILLAHADMGTTLLAFGLGEGGILLSVAAQLFAALASEDRLKIIGLVLTFAGIATEFLPPILDLLNIQVK